MSALHQVLLVLGLFGMPLALLIAGHRIKRSSQRRQRIFWGAVTGHLLAAAAALWVSLAPPIGWLPTDTLRGALGVWSLVALPLVGAVAGALRPSPEP